MACAAEDFDIDCSVDKSISEVFKHKLSEVEVFLLKDKVCWTRAQALFNRLLH